MKSAGRRGYAPLEISHELIREMVVLAAADVV